MTFGAKRINPTLFSIVIGGVICVDALVFSKMVDGTCILKGTYSETSTELTLEQLTTFLSLNPIHQVKFEEIYISQFLTTPIKKSGILRYNPPSRFEKHIVTPTQESFVIDHDTVTYNNLTQDVTQTLSLEDVPPLQVLITGLRSIFSRDLMTLKRYYQTELNGTHQQWALTMVPLNEKLRHSVKCIRLKGRKSQLQEIQIHESNGDHSTLLLQAL